MSPPFSLEEILEEFAEAGGRGREIFSGRGGFRFFKGRTDEERAKRAERMREWRRYNPELAKAQDRRSYEYIRSNPERLATFRARQARWAAARRAKNPAKRREESRRLWAAIKANPETLIQRRIQKREAYRRKKAARS